MSELEQHKEIKIISVKKNGANVSGILTRIKSFEAQNVTTGFGELSTQALMVPSITITAINLVRYDEV